MMSIWQKKSRRIDQLKEKDIVQSKPVPSGYFQAVSVLREPRFDRSYISHCTDRDELNFLMQALYGLDHIFSDLNKEKMSKMIAADYSKYVSMSNYIINRLEELDSYLDDEVDPYCTDFSGWGKYTPDERSAQWERFMGISNFTLTTAYFSYTHRNHQLNINGQETLSDKMPGEIFRQGLVK